VLGGHDRKAPRHRRYRSPGHAALSLAWCRDSAKRNSLLAMSKVMHSEVQSIVE
jgi:hypothetical protein